MAQSPQKWGRLNYKNTTERGSRFARGKPRGRAAVIMENKTILVWQGAPAAAAKDSIVFARVVGKRFGGSVDLIDFVKTKRSSLIYEDGRRRDAVFTAGRDDAEAILQRAKQKKNSVFRLSDIDPKERTELYGAENIAKWGLV